MARDAVLELKSRIGKSVLGQDHLVESMLIGLLANGGAEVPKDRPIDGVDQSDFFTGKTDKSAREGVLIWCADRLQAVKWRNYKVHFYQQETMVSPPVKLAIPFLFNLYTNPREDTDKQITDSWIIGPVLKMVGEFEASVKKHPLIAMGTCRHIDAG